MMDAIAVSYALALLGPLKRNKEGISENSGHKTILDLVDLLKAKQAEVDFLKAQLGIKRDQIKGFESEIKKTWQAVEKKDKRIVELELALTQIKSWESHPKSYETAFGSWGLRDFYRNLADKALRGEHE